LNLKKLFNSKQFGFSKGRPTVTQLLTVLNKWAESLENGGQVDAIYTGFGKALIKFNTNHLLAKCILTALTKI
jgi:hypothetical protein